LSAISTSFAFCVWITFSALSAPTPVSASSTLVTTTVSIHRRVVIALFLLSGSM
jgi:hypothetical protein